MARIITPEQIKHGDKIRIIRELTVGKAVSASDKEIEQPVDVDGDVWDREVGTYAHVRGQRDTIELVERTNPDLPEDMGHVLKVYDQDGEDGIWITQENGYVTSARNVRYTRADFLEFISRYDFSFEVVS